MNNILKVSVKDIPEVVEAMEKASKEIERLNNIINELEQWLIKQQIEEGEFCDFHLENKQIKVEEVLDKLQELLDKGE